LNDVKTFICIICGETIEANGNGNQNGKYKTRHHPGKIAVCGNNDYTLGICSKCHPRLENNISRGEAKILRLFLRVYAEINARFINSRGIDLSDDELVDICLKEFLRIRDLSRIEIKERLEKKYGFIDAIKNMINKRLAR